MLVPLNITGGTYKHKSLPLSAQVTRNFWPQKQEDSSTKSPYVLEGFHGLKTFGAVAGSRDRGMTEHLETLYKVTDEKLYSVDSAGTHTELGSIPGVARCILVGIGTNVVIVTEGKAYVWDGSNVTEVTDADLETPSAAAHLNNQIIYDGDGGRFATSDVGDATSINGLNYATAESNADDLIRPYVFEEILYLFGDKTTESWWNSGVGSPPFDRIQNGTLPIGLGALHSPANSINFMYFLGNDNQVHAVQGSSSVVVTTQAIAREFSEYSLISDAVGSCFNLDGQWIYVLTFPTANKTWAYPEGGEWFELSSGTENGKWRASSYAYAFRKHLFGDFESGNIYELDDDTYTENGETIIRVRDTGPLHGGLVGAPGKDLEVTRFELILEAGVGLLTGQGSDPVIMLSFSNDGGKTFGPEMWATIGKTGEFLHKVEWFNLGTAESWVFRVKVSDPVYYSIHSAGADVEVGI